MAFRVIRDCRATESDTYLGLWSCLCFRFVSIGFSVEGSPQMVNGTKGPFWAGVRSCRMERDAISKPNAKMLDFQGRHSQCELNSLKESCQCQCQKKRFCPSILLNSCNSQGKKLVSSAELVASIRIRFTTDWFSKWSPNARSIISAATSRPRVSARIF